MTMTVGTLIQNLLQTTDLSNQEIADKVRQQFPDAKTTAKSVASVASVARKYGVQIAKRPTNAPTERIAELERQVKVLTYLLRRKDRKAA